MLSHRYWSSHSYLLWLAFTSSNVFTKNKSCNISECIVHCFFHLCLLICGLSNQKRSVLSYLHDFRRFLALDFTYQIVSKFLNTCSSIIAGSTPQTINPCNNSNSYQDPVSPIHIIMKFLV